MNRSWIQKLIASFPRTLARPASRRSVRRSQLSIDNLEERSLLSTSALPSLSIPVLSNMNIPLGSNNATFDANGNVASADVHVSNQSFTKGGVTFTAQDLEVKYTAATSEYDISGSASVQIAHKTFTVTFGDANTPGSVVQNGSLTTLTGTLQAPDLSFGGAELTGTQLTVGYDSADDAISLSGSADLKLNHSQHFQLQLGDNNGPGLLVQNSQVVSVNAAISGSFSLGQLSVKSDGVRVIYAAATAASQQTFTISGNADFQLKGNTVNIDVKTAQIVGGTLQSFTGSVTSDIHLLGMTLTTKDLTVAYSASQNEVDIYGEIAFTAGKGETLNGLDATLGTDAKPGLQIIGGKLSFMDVTLNGGFHLAGLSVAPKDLEVTYDSVHNVVQLQGSLDIQMGSHLDVSATLDHGGITINTSTGAVQLNGLDIKGHLDLKSFQVDLDFKFSNTNGISVALDGEVTFPSGFTVGGSFDVENGQLCEIGLKYDAGATTGLPIADTGMFVTHIEGKLSNLNDVDHLKVDVTMGVTYGKKVTFMGNSYSLFDAMGTLTVDKNHLILDADVHFGGGLLGSGHGKVNLDWVNHVYKVEANLGLDYGIFNIAAQATIYENGALDIHGTGTVNLPAALPVIGGYKLAGAEVKLHYDPTGKTDDTITATGSLALFGNVSFSEDFGNNATFSYAKDGVMQVYHVLARGFTNLHQTFDHAKQILNDAWDNCGNETKDIYNAAGVHTRELYTTGGTLVRDIWDAAGDHAKEVLCGAADSVEYWNYLGDYTANIWDGAGGYVTETLSHTGQEVLQYFSQGLQTLEMDFSNGVKTLEKEFTAGVETMEQDFTNGVKTLEKDFNAAGGYVQTAFVNGVAQAAQNFDSAGNLIKDAVQQIAPAVEDVIDDISSWF
jgi:hypothetical protein